ncbi:RDD family protein [Kribbella swartbergensis]
MSTPPYGEQNRPGPFPPGQPGYGAQQPSPPGQPGGQVSPQGYNPYGPGGSGPGYGFGYAPPGQLAGWPIRVGASILDTVLQVIPMLIGVTVAAVLDANNAGRTTGGSATAFTLGYLGVFVVGFLNRVIQQGRTGQSFGKKVTGLKVVHAETGQLIGMGSTFGREFCAVVFNYICFLNVLWPLWDAKQQTWHDKVVNDVVIRL